MISLLSLTKFSKPKVQIDLETCKHRDKTEVVPVDIDRGTYKRAPIAI